ncbi:restriction endonuclease [Spartinivicinus ruber]|uniref:restriction endonuclease n=1 Tax=Spartinivicinus ruber TaxID=2683272 RepID=UPI0013D5D426|nr:restriction endonuclease [Spartinivicinus ruber]
MKDYLWIFIIIGAAIIWGIISWIMEIASDSKKYLELKPKLDNLENSIKEHELKLKKDREELELKIKKWNEKVENDKQEIKKIANQKSMGFPWLAEAYADYFALKDGEIEKYLRYKKSPAYKAAENVKIIKEEKKELVRENKIIKYKINYFVKLFPWLLDLIAEDEGEEIPVRVEGNIGNGKSEDRVKNYLTQEEYQSLPSVERNQMALDRYLRNRHKSKWAIGRDYEMYVGYLYDQKGYSIEYKGIIDGFEDLGRDIIARKKDEVCIIQCKCWAQYKEIHEKHIFQLFGTTMEYWIKNFKIHKNSKNFDEFSGFLKEDKLRPVFFTSASLSTKAKEMAHALNIEIVENEPLGEFPRIKCNINNDKSRQKKIYHLPMDQQYDRTVIGNRSGEFYAFTVKEAEDAGFRRAFKHRF